MVLSEPSFERSHCEVYYALNFETVMSTGYCSNCDYRPIIDRYFKVFRQIFSKDPWSAYNNITYSKIWQKLF